MARLRQTRESQMPISWNPHECPHCDDSLWWLQLSFSDLTYEEHLLLCPGLATIHQISFKHMIHERYGKSYNVVEDFVDGWK